MWKNFKGIVRYVGDLPQKTGMWYGVELDGPNGKNDGGTSVLGEKNEGFRYIAKKYDLRHNFTNINSMPSLLPSIHTYKCIL